MNRLKVWQWDRLYPPFLLTYTWRILKKCVSTNYQIEGILVYFMHILLSLIRVGSVFHTYASFQKFDRNFIDCNEKTQVTDNVYASIETFYYV